MSLSQPTLDVLRKLFDAFPGDTVREVLTAAVNSGGMTIQEVAAIITDTAKGRSRPEISAAYTEMKSNPEATERAIAGMLGMM